MTDEDNYFSNIYFEGIQTFEDLSIPREFNDIDSDETEFSNIEEKIMLDKIKDLLTLSNDNELFEKLLNELFEKLLNELFEKLFNELFNKLFNELFEKLSNNLSNNNLNNSFNNSLNKSLNELLNELNSLNDHNYTATSAIKNVCQAKRKISQIQKKAKKIKIN
jgi:uncharacterized membrane-anchored protein YjiN (DUF445 family)